MRYVLLLLVLSTTAYADDPPATLQKKAEQLEKNAKEKKDAATYVACGNAYLEIYNKFPDPGGDEVLYNAGVCFSEGKALGAALQAFELIKRNFPRSKIAPRALARSAMLYGDIAQFDRAAEQLEEYAMKYAGEKDAYDALSDAVLYRRLLGDREKLIANTNYLVKTFGRKKPAQAAEAMVNLGAVYEGDPDQQLAHMRLVLKTQKLDDAQAAFIHTKIGDLLSAKSCPVPLVEGLCIKLERDRGASKARCAKDRVRAVVAKRSDAYKDALAAYARAANLYERVAAVDVAGRHYAAMAKVALVDAQLEGLMQRKPPASKQLDEWVTAATKQAEPITEKYSAIISLREAQSALVSAARVGQTSLAVSRSLRLVEGAKDGTCKVVNELAAPLEQRAGDAFSVCVTKGAEFGVHDKYTRMCLREGRSIDAKRFPVRDVHPDASRIAIPIVADKVGEAAWRAGKKSDAIKAWEAALAKDGKLFAPRMNLAIARFEELRALPPGDPSRKQLAADIRFQAQNAIAVERHPAPLALLAVLAMDDKKQHDLAKHLLKEATRLDDKYAAAHVALGVLAVRRDEWLAAVTHMERAAELDSKSEAMQLELALAYLRVGRYDAAATRLATIKTSTYDVELARGVAARGLGKHDDAKAAYERAIKLDATRTEAAQNLGAKP
jgi:tetratricopeptide (TPR) repeat protein